MLYYSMSVYSFSISSIVRPIVLFNNIDTAFTYLDKETELFKVINVPMKNTIDEYK